MSAESAGRCASCGAALTPRSRFCRECGAAAEATELAGPPVEPSPPAPAAPACPSCGVATLPQASFCRSCGTRLGEQPPRQGDAPFAATPPTAEPPTVQAPPPVSAPQRDVAPAAAQSPPPRRRPLVVAAAIAACLAAGALVGAGAYLIGKDGDSGGGGVEGIVPGPDTGLAGGPSGGEGPESGEPTTDGGPIDGGPTDSEESPETAALPSGRYVQSGSFRTEAGAEEEVARLRERGIDVFAIPAAQTNELLPGFQVLLVGPLAGDAEERRVLRALEAAAVSGFGRDLTPSVELSGPSAAAGSWAGEVEQSYLRGAPRRSTYGMDVTIAADGETGSVEYPELDCGGTLTLLSDDGYSLAYEEEIEYGSCVHDGVVHLRPAAGALEAVWLHDEVDIMVEGTLSPLG